RVVVVGEPAQVAQHRGLAAVPGEDRVGEELGRALRSVRVRGGPVERGDVVGTVRRHAERVPHRGHVLPAGHLVAGDPDGVRVDQPQIYTTTCGFVDNT